MLNQRLANQYSKRFEEKTSGILKKYELSVIKIDINKNYRCPDFLVTNKQNKRVLVECKYIASAGLAPDGKTHISNLDPNLPNSGDIPVKSSIENQREALEEAHSQYLDLVKNEPKYINTPYVVAIGYDFFANFFDVYPSDFNDLNEISAIITLERDIEIKQLLRKLSQDELLKRIEDDSNAGLPQPSLRYKVMINKSARLKFLPNDFLKNPYIK